jgi:HD-GYP domain-containing protein (c-di-GMP phosphodiesterase class II)
VLLKRGKLTKKEFASMQRHAEIGDELLATVRSLDLVRPIVRHHHERIDGRGYPDGLRGDSIPPLAQIVSVVDVFDALTTDRHYRKALPVPTAYEMLREKAVGGWCELSVVDCFIDMHRQEQAHAQARVAV